MLGLLHNAYYEVQLKVHPSDHTSSIKSRLYLIRDVCVADQVVVAFSGKCINLECADTVCPQPSFPNL